MTQKSFKLFINEIYSQPPKQNYATNRTNVYYIDDVWSLEILDLNDYGPENNRGYRCVLVVFDNFSEFGSTLPLKNKMLNNKRLFRKCFDKFEKKIKFYRNRSR